MKKFLNYFLIFVVLVNSVMQIEAKGKANKKLSSDEIAGIVIAAVFYSGLSGYALYRLKILKDNKLSSEMKNTLSTKKSYNAIKEGVQEVKNAAPKRSAESVNQVEYDTALTNRKWVIEPGKTPELVRGITAKELSNAIKDYIGKGGDRSQVINDLKTEAANFVVDGKPSLAPDEWMKIAENLGLKGNARESFVSDIGIELEKYVSSQEFNNWSSDFRSLLDQSIVTKPGDVVFENPLTINPITNPNLSEAQIKLLQDESLLTGPKDILPSAPGEPVVEPTPVEAPKPYESGIIPID